MHLFSLDDNLNIAPSIALANPIQRMSNVRESWYRDCVIASMLMYVVVLRPQRQGSSQSEHESTSDAQSDPLPRGNIKQFLRAEPMRTRIPENSLCGGCVEYVWNMFQARTLHPPVYHALTKASMVVAISSFSLYCALLHSDDRRSRHLLSTMPWHSPPSLCNANNAPRRSQHGKRQSWQHTGHCLLTFCPTWSSTPSQMHTRKRHSKNNHRWKNMSRRGSQKKIAHGWAKWLGTCKPHASWTLFLGLAADQVACWI
jgi:hypothetical protein